MCGICGEFGHPDPARVKLMAERLQHRGPDDEGFYSSDNICLGVRRLSIIDLQTGHQPVTNEDGTAAVVFNGEIYNYQILRQGLLARGHQFRSESDTEVLVHLYEEMGERFLEQLRGMFAIAVWDVNRQRLLLARDRIGIKPLYLAANGATIAFASEIKALLAAGHAQAVADPVAIAQYLGFPCVPAPRTIVPGIRALKPAECVLISSAGQTSRTYWTLSFPEQDVEREIDESEAAGLVREKLRESVKIRLRSDVPLGAFLSGGIDSSAIVGLMGSILDRPVKTYSIAFTGQRHEFAAFNELSQAQEMAHYFHTDHTELRVSGGDVLSRLCRMVWAMDQPTGDALQYYLVSELARTGVTVALSGTGGDEVFGGYEWFKELLQLEKLSAPLRPLPRAWKVGMGEWLARLPSSMRSRRPIRRLATLLRGEESFIRRYRLNRRIYRGEELVDLLTPAVWAALVRAGSEADEFAEHEHAVAKRSTVAATSYLQIKTDLVNLLLRDQDAVSMAHSLEMRVPMVDHELVELAAMLPSRLKIKDGQEKFLLREAMRDLLPPATVSRRKKGFMFPMHLWMMNELAPVVRRMLSPEAVRRRGFFNGEAVSRLTEQFFKGKEPFFKIWNLVALELWCRMNLDMSRYEDPGATPVEALY